MAKFAIILAALVAFVSIAFINDICALEKDPFGLLLEKSSFRRKLRTLSISSISHKET